jgi:hypothetical protein
MPSPFVDWDRVPPFVREAVEDFPFTGPNEVAEFMALLVARIKSRLLNLPEPDESLRATDERAEWSWDLYSEMVWIS